MSYIHIKKVDETAYRTAVSYISIKLNGKSFNAAFCAPSSIVSWMSEDIAHELGLQIDRSKVPPKGQATGCVIDFVGHAKPSIELTSAKNFSTNSFSMAVAANIDKNIICLGMDLMKHLHINQIQHTKDAVVLKGIPHPKVKLEAQDKAMVSPAIHNFVGSQPIRTMRTL
ncbi:hypothetical protein Ddc_11136 [Ditylenchus destructor]|nr:hypothetical protein Ddc_11136 [Ditylenchus destructor]